MSRVSRSLRQVANFVGCMFGRLAAVIIGFVLMMVGLGFTASIVLLPAGVVLGLLGAAIFISGLFTDAEPTDRLPD